MVSIAKWDPDGVSIISEAESRPEPNTDAETFNPQESDSEIENNNPPNDSGLNSDMFDSVSAADTADDEETEGQV